MKLSVHLVKLQPSEHSTHRHRYRPVHCHKITAARMP